MIIKCERVFGQDQFLVSRFIPVKHDLGIKIFQNMLKMDVSQGGV